MSDHPTECAWCHCWIGAPPADTADKSPVSHGICEECAAELTGETETDDAPAWKPLALGAVLGTGLWLYMVALIWVAVR